MTPTTYTDSGSTRPAGTWPATVTDQGGLVVHSPVLPFARPRGAGPQAAGAQEVLRLTPEHAEAVIAMAARAPSLHNTQPWQFRVRGNAIELLVDPDRWLRHLDPDGRELMISCGAALFGLRLGLRSLGLLPATELLPDLAQPWLAARVRPAGRAAMNRVEAELVSAVPHRHTHRGAFTPGEVAVRLLAALVADSEAEGAELLLVSQTGGSEQAGRVEQAGRATLAGQLVRLVEEAAAEQRADPDLTAEIRGWARPPGSRARDGVPAWAIASRPGQSPAQEPEAVAAGARDQHQRASADSPAVPRFPQRDFGQRGSDQSGGVPPSATAVLSTAGDTPADWLRAGQALHRLLLRAATRWVFASLQTQPLESPSRRQQVRELLGLPGHPQLLLQLGRSNTAPATPRRPQAELRAD